MDENKNVTYDDILDWLQYHETAWEDAMEFFKIKVETPDSDDSLTDLEYDAMKQNVDEEDLVDWIKDHEELFDDFMRFFFLNNWTSVRFSAEDCDDYLEDDLRDAIDEFIFDCGYNWTGYIDIERSTTDEGREFVSFGFDFNHDGSYDLEALEDTIGEVFDDNNIEWDNYLDCESVTDRYE